MKTKLLTISIMFVAIAGCADTQKDLPKWKGYKTLGEIWSKVKSENAQKFIFCETDVPEIENWYVRFEVPEKAMDKSIQLMDKALKETKVRRDIWEIKRMKIVTDKGKYIVPVNWTSQKIYGNDWMSYELRNHLRKYGFADPE